MDYQGKQRFFRGTSSRKETLAMAKETENRHRLIRLGHLPSPEESHKPRPFTAVRDEYMAWGRSEGGLRGHPWSPDYAPGVERHLKFWERELSPTDIHDLDGCLPRVERALRRLKKDGLSTATLGSYADALHGLCSWCQDRDYIDRHPLAKLKRQPSTPEQERRAMTPSEITKLMKHCEPSRLLLYEVALCSGMRAKEIRALRAKHLDAERSLIHIEETWDKGRREWYHPIPQWLMHKLSDVANGLPANAPLFHVPGHTARNIRRDLKAARVAVTTPDGYLDFHALRTTYLTLVTEAGANTKEAQVLARHSASDLTHRVYVRVRDDRLYALAEAVGQVVNPHENYDPGMAQPPVRRQGDRPNPKSDETLDADQAPDGRRSCTVSPKLSAVQLHTLLVWQCNCQTRDREWGRSRAWTSSPPQSRRAPGAAGVGRGIWLCTRPTRTSPDQQLRRRGCRPRPWYAKTPASGVA